MPKRKEEEEEYWSDDDIYLPDESLKVTLHSRDTFITYKNGEIIVNEINENEGEKIQESQDYAIVKVWLSLQDYCKSEGLPLLDKKGATSADLCEFLQRFI